MGANYTGINTVLLTHLRERRLEFAALVYHEHFRRAVVHDPDLHNFTSNMFLLTVI